MFPVWAGSGPRSWSAALVRRVQYYIRFVQIAIDQNIIVDAVILNLSGRIPQPPFDHSVAIFSACAQALLQDFWRRSQDKHGDSVGKPTLQLSRTLHGDVPGLSPAPGPAPESPGASRNNCRKPPLT